MDKIEGGRVYFIPYLDGRYRVYAMDVDTTPVRRWLRKPGDRKLVLHLERESKLSSQGTDCAFPATTQRPRWWIEFALLESAAALVVVLVAVAADRLF